MSEDLYRRMLAKSYGPHLINAEACPCYGCKWSRWGYLYAAWREGLPT